MLEHIDSSLINICEGLYGYNGFDMFLAVAVTIPFLMALWKLVECLIKQKIN